MSSVKQADGETANRNAARAVALLQSFRNLGRAHQLISEAISMRPRNANWYAIRSQIYRALGRNWLAYYDINTSIRLDPRGIRYYAM